MNRDGKPEFYPHARRRLPRRRRLLLQRSTDKFGTWPFSFVTPGELLQEEFLTPLGISQYRLAKEIGVSARRINEIVKGMRSVTADTDLRLCRFFGLSDGYRLRAQAAHDTEVARVALADVLAKIRPLEHA